MKYNLPQSITSEKDLTLYEEYLKCDLKKSGFGNASISDNRNSDFNRYLNNQKGKLVKIEICSERVNGARMGVIFDVGSDYIVIKQNKTCETVIPLSAIKVLTVVNGNRSYKAEFN